ncbi:MAG: glycosyltransferase [Pseudomonadota bacterium]
MGVSVIIPSYNRSSMLRKTLCGLICQKGYSGPLEVIIVDNGSGEDTFARIADLRVLLPIRMLKRELVGTHFRPGSARNLGAIQAQYNQLLFLDSDCVPSEYLVYFHVKELRSGRRVVTIGHRVFVDDSICPESIILTGSDLISYLSPVASASNYLEVIDRRIPELNMIARHPAPYNCLHGCNVGLRKEDFFEAGMFDLSFDGHWGYEDIELGYRLYRMGIRFVYLPEAVVYHLEGEGLSLAERLTGRVRNYALACKKIPHYDSFRKDLGR